MVPQRTGIPYFFRLSLLGGWLAIAAALHAAEGGFTATLSSEQKIATGLDRLAAEQRALLDRIVATEVAGARNDAGGLDGTFLSRRTDEERKQTGLNQLTGEQRDNLNLLVASAVAANPQPRERPRIRDAEIFTRPRKAEVHGGVSLTYGRSSGGGDFRSASMWVDYFDPNSGLGLGIGITRSKGSGFHGFYPGYYGFGPSFYGSGLDYMASPFWGFGRSRWYDDDDLYFRDRDAWNGPSYRRGLRPR